MPKQIASKDMYEVSDNIRNRRKEIGMTQVQLASAAQLGENTIQRIESGQAQASIESFFRLAQALGVTPNDLAPVAYGFSKTDEQLKGLLDQFQLLSEKDKQYFIKTATIFMSGLLIQSAT